MRHLPEEVPLARVRSELEAGWAIRPVSLEHLPLGGGSYHWRSTESGGRQFFVTVDDLGDKSWLGDTPGRVFDGLSLALRTAEELGRSGLDFVVGPVCAQDGSLTRRVDGRYCVSVFPYLDGHSYPFGPYADGSLRRCALDMVAMLHRSTPALGVRAPHVLGYGGQRELADFLLEPRRPWTQGPFAEPTRRLLAEHLEELGGLVAGFDRQADRTYIVRGESVITHGEPHPANLVSVDGRVLLVDRDTVALAPPERDLALIVRGLGPDIDHYQATTGHGVNWDVVTLYQLRWYLDDLASTVQLFRGPHDTNPHTRHWWDGLAPRVEQLPRWLARLAEEEGSDQSDHP